MADLKVVKKVLFMVMKLQTDFEITDRATNLTTKIAVEGVYGFIPVYETVEEAEIAAEGKHKIIAIELQ